MQTAVIKWDSVCTTLKEQMLQENFLLHVEAYLQVISLSKRQTCCQAIGLFVDIDIFFDEF